MKRLSLLMPFIVAIGSNADAEQAHVLRGLFCNSEAQIEETLDHMRMNLAPHAAVGLTNRNGVVCVYADRLQYVVTRAFVVREAMDRSGPLIEYEATLVGVLVGERLRPVEPPVQVFFIHPDRLPNTRPARAA
jgi:hypothetical protein